MRQVATWALAGALLAGVISPSRASADDDEGARAWLKGVQSVAVEIGLTSDLQHAGVDSAALRTDVELKLRHAGIAVKVNDASYLGPILKLRVGSVRACFGDQFGVYEELVLLRMVDADPSDDVDMLYVACWASGDLLALGKDRLDEVRSRARDLADRFLNAYLDVNPAKVR